MILEISRTPDNNPYLVLKWDTRQAFGHRDDFVFTGHWLSYPGIILESQNTDDIDNEFCNLV